MEKKEIEELRQRVGCGALLVKGGFVLDKRESTRRALKFRRQSEIIIVTHGDKGWFDPLSDAKGDVFSLAVHLGVGGFTQAVKQVADLVGFVPQQPYWKRTIREARSGASIPERWAKRRMPWPGSMTWRYLRDERSLPDFIIRAAVRQDGLREGPRGSMWAAHRNDAGVATGWEERGPEWRGFSTGGSKVLFRLGEADGPRFCVTEAAIDAMSLAAFEGLREGSLYLSTGGGWSPATAAAVRKLAARPGAVLISATDANDQGEIFAGRLRDIADEAGCDWLRLKPPSEDWNEALRARREEKKEGKARAGIGGLPHARRPLQG